MKKSWRTTLFGALGALGFYLESQTASPWLPIAGKVLQGVSVLLVGAYARDNKVNSREAGAE